MIIPSPNVVFHADQPTDFSGTALSLIVEQLNNQNFVRYAQRDREDGKGVYFEFKVDGYATKGDKEVIKEILMEAGWGEVLVVNDHSRSVIIQLYVHREHTSSPGSL